MEWDEEKVAQCKPHTIQRCPSSALKVHEYYPTSMPFSLPCAKISESVVVFDGIKRVFGCSQWQKERGIARGRFLQST